MRSMLPNASSVVDDVVGVERTFVSTIVAVPHNIATFLHAHSIGVSHGTTPVIVVAAHVDEFFSTIYGSVQKFFSTW